jgi:large subunit ribosomal protein L35
LLGCAARIAQAPNSAPDGRVRGLAERESRSKTSRSQTRDTMPKMKTNRAAAKRFKKTGKGHFRCHKQGHRHGMISKNRKRNRRLRKPATVDAAMEKRLRVLLPYA